MTSPTQHVNPTTKLFRVAIVRLQSILLDIKKKVIVSDTSVSKLSTLFGAGNRGRTCMVSRKILNLVRLPVPPYLRY